MYIAEAEPQGRNLAAGTERFDEPLSGATLGRLDSTEHCEVSELHPEVLWGVRDTTTCHSSI